jgi:hypothetical protein
LVLAAASAIYVCATVGGRLHDLVAAIGLAGLSLLALFGLAPTGIPGITAVVRALG